MGNSGKMLKLVTFLVIIHNSLGRINNRTFPSDFMFGIASAAYQIEGAWDVDGKGLNIWDNFTHSDPTQIRDGSNGDVAADGYHHYKEDVELLKSLGVKHYRFSLSWARILPTGFPDEINSLGIKHYQDLIQLLKDNNIEPIVTLYHWDLPQVLQDYGGFLNESLKDWFSDYATVCFEMFGDDVKYWSTFNEPQLLCWLGYGLGVHPPGILSEGFEEYRCGHNLLKAHAAAWHAYEENFRIIQGGSISFNLPIDYYGPLTNSSEDIGASEQALQFHVGQWVHPLYYGDYPDIVKNRIANRSKLEGFNQSRLPEFTEDEKSYLKGTLDYFSINTYHSYYVKAISEPDITLPPSSSNDIGVEVIESDEPNGSWGILPLLKWIQNEYNDPDIIITENGVSSTVGLEDDDRIAYVRDYLSGVRDAIDDDVKIFGYTLWTFLDTFEWDSGYTIKMGIYQVDFDSDNKTRTPRKSANWYRNVISTYCLLDVCED